MFTGHVLCPLEVKKQLVVLIANGYHAVKQLQFLSVTKSATLETPSSNVKINRHRLTNQNQELMFSSTFADKSSFLFSNPDHY